MPQQNMKCEGTLSHTLLCSCAARAAHCCPTCECSVSVQGVASPSLCGSGTASSVVTATTSSILRTLSLQLQQPLLLPRLLRLLRSSITTRTRTATSARSSVWRFASCTRRAATKHTSQHAFLATSALCATGWHKKIRTTLLAAAVLARLTKRWIQHSSLFLTWNPSPPHVS